MKPVWKHQITPPNADQIFGMFAQWRSVLMNDSEIQGFYLDVWGKQSDYYSETQGDVFVKHPLSHMQNDYSVFGHYHMYLGNTGIYTHTDIYENIVVTVYGIYIFPGIRSGRFLCLNSVMVTSNLLLCEFQHIYLHFIIICSLDVVRCHTYRKKRPIWVMWVSCWCWEWVWIAFHEKSSHVLGRNDGSSEGISKRADKQSWVKPWQQSLGKSPSDTRGIKRRISLSSPCQCRALTVEMRWLQEASHIISMPVLNDDATCRKQVEAPHRWLIFLWWTHEKSKWS